MREHKLENRRNSSPWSQLNGGDGSKANSHRRDAGLGAQGPKGLFPRQCTLLLGSQPRAPDSQHSRCQEDTVKPLNEVSSHSSSGRSPRKHPAVDDAAG